MEYKRLGDYIREVNVRNRELKVTKPMGINIDKHFMPSIANTIGTDMSTYKIVDRGQFAYGPVTSRNGDKVSIALLDGYDGAIISQAYTVFKVQDTNKLLPEYLFMFFNRPEFDRYARFNSWGSAREVFTMDDMNDVAIPIPDISVQREIVNIHKCYIERQRIAEALKEQLKKICPVLIRGSLMETGN